LGIGQIIKQLMEEQNLCKCDLLNFLALLNPVSVFLLAQGRKIPLKRISRLASFLEVGPLEFLQDELELSGTFADKNYTDLVVGKTALFMEDMPEEKRRGVFNCVQEKKLLTGLLKGKI
jgi:hypothetical protein